MAITRTSQTHPLQIAELSCPQYAGKIGITFCPGKYDPLAATGKWDRDLTADLDTIEKWGASAILTLIEAVEMIELRVPHLGQAITERKLSWYHNPIHDYSIPNQHFETQWINERQAIYMHLAQGENVLVHCKGGLGRAGMIAARMLIELGCNTKLAIREVRRVRPGAIETRAQLNYVQHQQLIARHTC